MSESIEKVKVAPFLVSSSQQRDFTTIVAPDYICDANISDLLRKAVSRYNQPTESGKAILIEIFDSEVGTIYVVFRTVWALGEYIGNQGNELLRDPVRPIPFIEGFVLKEPIASDVVASVNFEIAHQQVVNYYQAFWRSPQPTQRSESFDLQTDNDVSSNLALVKTQFPASGKVSRGKSWRCISTLIPDRGLSKVCSLAFSPDGKLIASRYIDQTVKLWDWSEQRIEFSRSFWKRESISSIAFSPSGKTIITAIFDQSRENIIKVLNWRTGEENSFHQKSREATFCIVTCYDFGQEWLFSGSQDKSLELWNLSQNKHHYSFKKPHLYPIRSLTVSPNGKILVSGDEEGVIKTWGTEKGERRGKARPSLKSINSLAISPNSQIIASASKDGMIKIFRAENLEEVRELTVNSSINSITFSPSGQILASGSDDGQIRIWDIEKNELLLTIDEHKKEVMTVAFSIDGLLASGSKDGEIKVWREGW